MSPLEGHYVEPGSPLDKASLRHVCEWAARQLAKGPKGIQGHRIDLLRDVVVHGVLCTVRIKLTVVAVDDGLNPALPPAKGGKPAG